MRLTLGDVKSSRIPSVCGGCPNDQRVTDLLNESVQRLLPLGHWVGTCLPLRICATDGCVTFPVQIESLEVAAVCNRPIPILDWFSEFNQGGIGLRKGGRSFMDEAIPRGNFPVFNDLRGTGKKLRFICDRSTDVGKPVLALGYDDNSNWIRTLQNGAYADGEVVLLSQSPGTNSVNNFSVVTDLQPPNDLDGQWWLWEYTDATTQRMIGKYEFFETRPSYRRYFFPTLSRCPSGKATPIDVIAKLAFIPVKKDTDYLIIGYLPALKDMCQALNAAEHERDATKKTALIAAGMQVALAGLDAELSAHLGSGRRMEINVQGSSICQNDLVPVVI